MENITGGQNDVFVYVAKFPFQTDDDSIFPPERRREIESCANETVRAQKFFVWKLLEYALEKSFGLNMKTLSFFTERGRWSCSACDFSLTHCDRLCAVALSENRVGVDLQAVESERFIKLGDKILTARESETLKSLPDHIRGREISLLWTKKEALFKREGGAVFVPKNIETDGGHFAVKTVCEGGMEYFLTVATAPAQGVTFFSLNAEMAPRV